LLDTQHKPNLHFPMPLRLLLLAASLLTSATASVAADPPLPHPATFDPARYLGLWHEAARLPAAYQPDNTLATAEYAATDTPGRITVKNRAYSADGSLVATIAGEADLVPGDPPGRLSVRFGPAPAGGEPNYYVMHVDKDYTHAVVGVPSRNALWILSRSVPVPKQKLDELVAIAKKAGFDTGKLLIAPWQKPVAPAAESPEQK
jgi:apolipoprotein D and lipocalin family protein